MNRRERRILSGIVKLYRDPAGSLARVRKYQNVISLAKFVTVLIGALACFSTGFSPWFALVLGLLVGVLIAAGVWLDATLKQMPLWVEFTSLREDLVAESLSEKTERAEPVATANPDSAG